jgi:2-oxoglutarate ferredoxin oxidoreductase subunit delta
MARKDFKKIEYKEGRFVWQTFPEICKSCGVCIEKCPVKCLSYDQNNSEYLGMPAVKIDIKKCIACGTCERVCPDCAIRVEGKK